MAEPLPPISYKRSRFSTRLPQGRRYTRSHGWLAEVEPGLWRVGLTRFATRMLGDVVEHGFEVKPGAPVAVGDIVGWIEGFKATSDLYCVAAGEFAGTNEELLRDPTRIDKDPYTAGWLYEVRGEPDPASVDAEGYVVILNHAIDRIQGKLEGGQS